MRSILYFLIAVLLCGGMAGCPAGRAFSTGESLEREGKYEEAMLSYAEAFRIAPEEMEYRMRFLGARDKAAVSRYEKGMEGLKSCDYTAALSNFQVAYGLDPGTERYKQLVESTTRKRDAQQFYREGMEFEKDNKPKFAGMSYGRAVALDPEEAEYAKAGNRVRLLLDNRPNGYELNLKSHKPFAFKFTGSGLKDVFRILTQLSGINFIFDEGVRDQPVTINLEKTNFRQVLDLLTTMNKLGTTILNDKTVLIYPNTADKTKQYEDLELRTFHLNFMDAKKAINLIRTMLPARKIYVNEEANSVVVRDTSEVISVIARLLEANDIPDAEVLLDVEVIEFNDKNIRSVGLMLSRYSVDLGPFNLDSGLLLADRLSSAQSATGTATDAGIDNLVNVFNWNGVGGFVTVPNATYNFGKTIAKGEVLSNPKIRVKNKEKAKFTVGTRVPITTTTSNGTVGGYSVNVQYVDVGVKLNAEPVIQLNNTIDIKLSLEVSSILSRETVGSEKLTTVVTIGTRNLETVLSLKDGETSIIGGLKSRTNTDSKTKIFLLGDIPLLGPFISGNDNTKEKTEIVLAITPRLIRGLSAPAADVVSFMSGKEDNPSLAPFPPSPDEELAEVTGQPGAGQGAASPAAGRRLMPGAPFPQPGAVPGPTSVSPSAATGQTGPDGLAATGEVMPEQAQPWTGQPAEAVHPVATAEAVTSAAAPSSDASLKGGEVIISSPMTGKVGETFTLEIRAANVEAVSAAPFVLTYDASLVEPVSFAEGTFFKKQGMKSAFSSSVDAGEGSVSINIALPPGNSGVSGNGVLATAVFRPRKQGIAAFGFRDVAFRTVDGRRLDPAPFATSISIQ